MNALEEVLMPDDECSFLAALPCIGVLCEEEMTLEEILAEDDDDDVDGYAVPPGASIAPEFTMPADPPTPPAIELNPGSVAPTGIPSPTISAMEPGLTAPVDPPVPPAVDPNPSPETPVEPPSLNY